MRLTEEEVEAAKPKEKAYKLYDGKGLTLQVFPNGGKYWRVKYRWNGKEKNLALGTLEEVTLIEARIKTQEAREQLKKGLDPSIIKQIRSGKIRMEEKKVEEELRMLRRAISEMKVTLIDLCDEVAKDFENIFVKQVEMSSEIEELKKKIK